MDCIIYGHIFLDSEDSFSKFLRTFRARDKEFFRLRVHSLGIYHTADNTAQDTAEIIETCSNIHSLWWLPRKGKKDDWPKFLKSHPNLQMISILHRDLTIALSSEPSYHPWRQSLQTLDMSADYAHEFDFTAFPNLTIVSLFSHFFRNYEESFCSVLLLILAKVPLLECLILGVDGPEVYEASKDFDMTTARSTLSFITEGRIHDPRLIVIPMLTFSLWKQDVTGEKSYWDQALLTVQTQRDMLSDRNSSGVCEDGCADPVH